jgi:hypothetical protein
MNGFFVPRRRLPYCASENVFDLGNAFLSTSEFWGGLVKLEFLPVLEPRKAHEIV